MTQKDFYLTKRGKFWYARIRDPLTRKIGTPRSTGQSNLTRADAWARVEYASMERLSGSSKDLLRDWADRFYKKDCPHISRLTDENKSIADYTKKQTRGYIEKYILTDIIADIPLAQINRTHILDFRDRIVALKGRTRTSQLIYGALRTIMLEAVARGLIESSPTTGLHKLAYPKKTRPAVPMSSVLSILNVSCWQSIVMWRATLMAAMTGMRAGEVRGLQWEDVDVAKKVIHICHNIPMHSKTLTAPKWHKERTTVYPARLRELMEPLREDSGFVFKQDGKAISYEDFRDALIDACIKAETRATLHQLRHSLQTALRGAGVADDMLRGAFGWSSETVQDGYTHRELYDLAPMEDAIAKLL